MIEKNKNHYSEAMAVLIIVAGIFFFASKLGLKLDVAIGESVSIGAAIVFGLIASFTTCTASVGGLLVGMMNRYHEVHPVSDKEKRFIPYITFNLGRVLGYAIFGYAVGYIGSIISVSPLVNASIVIIASLMMIVLGLQMLGINFGINRLMPHMPLFLARKVHSLADHPNNWIGVVGALTFFLPCGFTQALQLYVLGSGDALQGAILLGAFAIGTVPGLLTLGAIESFTSGDWHKELMKYLGAAMIIFSLTQINYGLRAFGWNAQGAAREYVASENIDDVQVVKMKVSGYEYYPSQFTVKKGVPVEWRIDATRAAGCATILVANKINLVKRLNAKGETVIKFTPKEEGRIDFSCSMGMTTPDAHFLVE